MGALEGADAASWPSTADSSEGLQAGSYQAEVVMDLALAQVLHACN